MAKEKRRTTPQVTPKKRKPATSKGKHKPIRRDAKSDDEDEGFVLPIAFRRLPNGVSDRHDGPTGNTAFDELWTEALDKAPGDPADLSLATYRRRWAWHWIFNQLFQREFDFALVLPFTDESRREFQSWYSRRGHTIALKRFATDAHRWALSLVPDAELGRKVAQGRPPKVPYDKIVETYRSIEAEGKVIGKTAIAFKTAEVLKLKDPRTVWRALNKQPKP